MTVICKDNEKTGKRLKKDRKYTVLIVANGYYRLKGVGGFWYCGRFEVVKEEKQCQ